MDVPLSDEDLMLRYRTGDAASFERLYARHRAPLFRYLLRQCRDRSIAEELFQDVWLQLVRARERYQVRAKFTTYLYTIAHNRVIDHYRRSASGLPGSYRDDDPIPVETIEADRRDEPEHRAATAGLLEQFSRLLEQLPDAQREAFLLRQETGMSVAEIAATLGVNKETAKSRLRYAMVKLRQGLREDD